MLSVQLVMLGLDGMSHVYHLPKAQTFESFMVKSWNKKNRNVHLTIYHSVNLLSMN